MLQPQTKPSKRVEILHESGRNVSQTSSDQLMKGRQFTSLQFPIPPLLDRSKDTGLSLPFLRRFDRRFRGQEFVNFHILIDAFSR